MFADPIKLTVTLDSLLPKNGGFGEEEFRLKDLNSGGSVRIFNDTVGTVKTLSTAQQDSSEFKSTGYAHKRTNVRIAIAFDGDGGSGTIVHERGYVQVTVTHPVGAAQVTPAALQAAFMQLAQLLLTQTDDATANTAMSCVVNRWDNILNGEP
jgi:hypothetical protein